LTVGRTGRSTGLSGTLLDRAISPSPARMAEACPIITYSVASAIVLTLSNFAVLAGPAILTSAGTIETVTMSARATYALNQTAVSAVVAVVTHTATTSANAVVMAVGDSAQIDSARGSSPPIRAQTNSILANPIQARWACPNRAVVAFVSLRAKARGIRLACSMLLALVRANLRLTLGASVTSIAFAPAILAGAMNARGAANLN